MKRLFYSTVAVLAFSLSSMANEIEEKNVELQKIETTSETPCADQWSADVDFFQEYLGVSFRKAMRLADLAFEKCLDDLYGE